MKIKLWGKKSEAVFDYWSFGHFIWFYFLTRFFFGSYSIERALLICIIIAYVWEVIERWLEDYDQKRKKVFFKEKECWMNRYVGDLISGLAGFFIGYFY